MSKKVECFIANLEGYIYIIPTELRDKFDGTDFYDRNNVFQNYLLPDDAILDIVLVDSYDLQSIIDGDFY